MNLKYRVARLAMQMRCLVEKDRHRPRYLKNKSLEEAAELIDRAFLPESETVFNELEAQMEEYAALPPHEYQGVETPRIHGFEKWLYHVATGNTPLPHPIPHNLLLAWKNGYEKHPCKPCTPILGAMCLHCEVILPNSTVDGGLPWPSPCPVCQSTNIKHVFGLHHDPRLAWLLGTDESNK